MSDLLTKWLKHYDPIHRGWTMAGIMAGTCATHGWFFPRVGGGYNLYRGLSRSELAEPAGAAAQNATTIRPFGWLSQAADTLYWFAVRAVGPGGVEAIDVPSSPPITRVRTDGVAEAAEPVPTAPRRVAAAPVAGGRMSLAWDYEPSGHFVAAARWRIYSDSGSGVMDWVTPLATVLARSGQGGAGPYGYRTAAWGHGLTVQFCVRAVSAAGVEEPNAVLVSAIADAEGPADHAVTAASWGADE